MLFTSAKHVGVFFLSCSTSWEKNVYHIKMTNLIVKYKEEQFLKEFCAAKAVYDIALEKVDF